MDVLWEGVIAMGGNTARVTLNQCQWLSAQVRRRWSIVMERPLRFPAHRGVIIVAKALGRGSRGLNRYLPLIFGHYGLWHRGYCP
jgi:hypothetical protein